MQVVILIHDTGADTYRSILVNVPCPLAVIERGTASCLKQAMQAATDIPHLEVLRQLKQSGDASIFSADFVCCDKAGPNSCCEDAVYSQSPDYLLRSRLPCFAHTVSTSQCRGFNSIPEDISGMLAAGLLMKPAGSTQGFRDCVRCVLETSCCGVLDAPPLPETHPTRQHLRSLLWLCLPGNAEGLASATRLMSLITGDIAQETLLSYGCLEEF